MGQLPGRCILHLMFQRIALLLLALAVALPSASLRGQNTPSSADPSGVSKPQKPISDPAEGSGQPPQIVVTSQPTQAARWTWREQVQWGAEIGLVVLGYLGVFLALRTLKNIQRQTDFGVSAAQAALQCANAALESSQAIVDSGRPWIVITVEPFLSVEHGFKVMATNRGRTPARILAKADCVKIAADESKLPAVPDYGSGKSSTPFEPIILLPGESAGIRPFRRADVRAYCSSDDQLKRIERWDEKLFVYGRVIYRDLISPMDQPNHETDWCCWYVFSEKDALVIAGPPEYNKHN